MKDRLIFCNVCKAEFKTNINKKSKGTGKLYFILCSNCKHEFEIYFEDKDGNRYIGDKLIYRSMKGVNNYDN